jgi:pyruvate ferredoxin oxidoreductase delta subunit
MSKPRGKPIVKPRKPKRLLGPVATVFATANTGSWRTVRPEIELALCVRCGICVIYCPTAVLELLEDEGRPLRIDWNNCKGCGICANVCPKRCITMVREEDQHEP